MLKKLFSILLLSCLLFNTAGYHLIFYIRQAEIKAEMKRSLLHSDNKEVDLLVFSLNDKKNIEKLEWEDDDEFELNGEMYDVIEKKTQNGKLIIRCINDKRETELIKNYEKINKEGNSKNRTALLLKLLDNTSASPVTIELFIKNILKPAKVSFCSIAISSCYHDVLTPPPRVS